MASFQGIGSSLVVGRKMRASIPKAKEWPIIQIIGLPGAGKTTLGKKLAKKFKLPTYRIGTYRSKFPLSAEGEADTWVALFRDLSKHGWKNCILETSGLNARECFLRGAFPFLRIITIKLVCQRKVLYSRINKKAKKEKGTEWLFSPSFHDKYEFTKKMFKHFKNTTAEITIDTTRLDPTQVFKTALKKIKNFMNKGLLSF